MISLTATVMQAWMRRGCFAYLAWPFAQLFTLIQKLRALMYRMGWLTQQRLPVPVIVVGNIFIGGTGKTPFTLWLLDQLKQAGYTPGVISRGYGGKDDAARTVSSSSAPGQVGDEPVLIAQRSACPVVVGRNRVEAGQKLLATNPKVDVIISDDGLQHTALARDVEIVMFDSRGAGNGWLLPAGPLREPMNRPRDFTVANINEGEKISADLPKDSYRMQLNGTRAYQLLDASKTQQLNSMEANLNIVAAAGIGNPERFFTMLGKHGVRCSALPLPDHYHFEENPFKHISADMVLITEKDAVKCRQNPELANDQRIWVVAVNAEVDAELAQNIIKKIKRD